MPLAPPASVIAAVLAKAADHAGGAGVLPMSAGTVGAQSLLMPAVPAGVRWQPSVFAPSPIEERQ
jgi:hypothetical protein